MSLNNINQIALIGLPRSGTTWVAKLIDSHPGVIYRHEPDTEFRINAPIIIHSGDQDYRQTISDYCKDIINRRGVRVCGKQPFFRKSYFGLIAEYTFKLSLFGAKLANKFGIKLKIIEPIKLNGDELVLLWKSIESSGRVGEILRSVPDIKIIYLIRNPFGQISSILDGEEKYKFDEAMSSADDFDFFEFLLETKLAKDRGLTIEKIKEMSRFARLALKWVLLNEHALEELEKFPDRSIVIRYKDVCMDSKGLSSKIFEFVGLEWNIQTEDFVKHSSQNNNDYYSVKKIH